MILLSKNETQAAQRAKRIMEHRTRVTSKANETLEAATELYKGKVKFEVFSELLAKVEKQTDIDIRLASGLLVAWKTARNINIPLNMLNISNRSAWPDEVVKVYDLIRELHGSSQDLKKYWNDKQAAFVDLPLTEAEEMSIYEHYEEYVKTEAAKKEIEFLEMHIRFVNKFNKQFEHFNQLNTGALTVAHLRETYPHLVKYFKPKPVQNRDKVGPTYFELDKSFFISKADMPEIFV